MSDKRDLDDAERAYAALLERDLADERPSAGWQREVWARLDARAAQRRWRWVWMPALGVAVAAAVLLMWLRPQETQTPAQLAVAFEVEANADAPRTRAAEKVGDTVVVRVRDVPPGQHVDVRVYRDDALVARCTPDVCQRGADTLVLRVRTDRPGTYRSVVVSSGAPLPPPPEGRYGPDTIRVIETGGQVVREDQREFM